MEFTLRPWKEDDLESLVLYANNPKIAANLRDMFPHPYTETDGRGFIERATGHQPNNVLAIDVEGQAVGAIGIHPQTDIYRKNAEMGYWLAEPLWGNGIMTRAVVRMVDYGFKNWDITRIFAVPFETNTGSQMVLEKAGFILEARFEKTIYKNGQFLDELVYAARRNTWKGPVPKLAI
ncbi:MAG: N-acetyltransferase [Bacteroidetes bacterium]|nr:MAG: N-acetyltransferase [Bacteroidota bacterium]